jgi:hypothetical protein
LNSFGLFFAYFAVQGFSVRGTWQENQKIFRAKDAKKGRKVREEIQLLPSFAPHTLFPTFEFFRGKRFEEFRPNRELSFEDADLPGGEVAAPDWNQPNDRNFTARYDNLLAQTCLLDQAREIGPGFANAESFHRISRV